MFSIRSPTRTWFLVGEGRGDDGEVTGMIIAAPTPLRNPGAPSRVSAPRGHLGCRNGGPAATRTSACGVAVGGNRTGAPPGTLGRLTVTDGGVRAVRRSPPCVRVEVGTSRVPGRADQQHQTRGAVIGGCWCRVARSASFGDGCATFRGCRRASRCTSRGVRAHKCCAAIRSACLSAACKLDGHRPFEVPAASVVEDQSVER
jgi:hypothetical protein